MYLKLSRVSTSRKYSSNGRPSYIHNPGQRPLQYETIGRCLKKAANSWPNRTFLVSHSEGFSMTFSQVLEEVCFSNVIIIVNMEDILYSPRRPRTPDTIRPFPCPTVRDSTTFSQVLEEVCYNNVVIMVNIEDILCPRRPLTV